MHVRGLTAALAAALLAAGAIAGLVPAAASAATCQSTPAMPPPGPGTNNNEFHGVAVLSLCDAWAVGVTNSGVDRSLTEHWDGTAWTVVPVTVPGSLSDSLAGVRALSATNAWAVGTYTDSVKGKALILHWNGATWTQLKSPNPGTQANQLTAVRLVSATDIWAVGWSNSGAGDRPLILHWNGTSWKAVPSHSPAPPPPGDVQLSGVAATSASNAWATGNIFTETGVRSFILRWNGTSWATVKTVAAGDLNGIGASSASNAWAVGSGGGGDLGEQTLTLHWDGHTWARVKSPNPAPAFGQLLRGVVVTSASSALAVGQFDTSSNGVDTLMLRWDGHTWQQLPSGNPGTFNFLFAVSGNPAGTAWAVGSFATNPVQGQALALHCC